MRECADGFILYDAGVIADFLELGGSFSPLMSGQIRRPQRARNPIMVQLTGRLPLLQGR